MEPKEFIRILKETEPLKDNTRHSWTSGGSRETVAAHSWSLCLMALLCRDAFPQADMDKVLRMCVIHDIGEAFTGDVPCFEKTDAHEAAEAGRLAAWVQTLPPPYRAEFAALYAEMDARQTLEARIYKALDNLEAVQQHNLADLATWLPLEYSLNQTYGADKCAGLPFLEALQAQMAQDTRDKLAAAGIPPQT